MSNDIEEVLVGIPSLSPQTCMRLLHIGETLKAKASKETNPKIRAELLDFADAIGRVCAYSALHQKVVLDRFGELVGKRRKEKE